MPYLSSKKKIFLILFCLKQQKSFPPPNEILYENSICEPNERGGGAHWVGIL